MISAPAAAGAGQRLVDTDQASCFYHPNKTASIPCDNCGRFLCALCDVDFGGKHLCPACIEGGGEMGPTSALDADRVLYDYLALLLAIVPTILTQVAAIFLAIKYWSSPISIPARGRLRWRWMVVLAIAILELWMFYEWIFGGFLR